MLTLAQSLSYYKRKDVQQLIVQHTQNKEVGVRFNESFGKRPDVVNYESDILEFAKNGVTSFHISEETWQNPLAIRPEMKRNELDAARIGWDLILDIDCPYWTFSKLTAYLFIKALKDHHITSVSVKFSGGKGFHIGVPFEAFPQKKFYYDGKYWEIKDLFPEGPRLIAQYLLYYINTELLKITDDKIFFAKFPVAKQKLIKETGKSNEELITMRCADCKTVLKDKDMQNKDLCEYICPHCETTVKDVDKQYMLCPNCKKLMEKRAITKPACASCGSYKTENIFDLSSIVAVDTVLISSRHLYRMPYSLHEKTGLVSVPFDIKHILKFEKDEALPSKFKPFTFLDRSAATSGEAENLFQKAFEHVPAQGKKQQEKNRQYTKEIKGEGAHDLEARQEMIPEEFFPPCIKKISLGIEDGKKRALFILINFLSTCHWPDDKIEEYVLAWNERNSPEKIRETYVRGQLRYARSQKIKLPPPNCDNRGYMIDTQFCNPDGLCKYIKNPVQYAKRKAYMTSNEPGRKKKGPVTRKDGKTKVQSKNKEE